MNITELLSALITAGVTLTFVALVVQNPQGVSQSLQGAASAGSTFFGTFLGRGPMGSPVVG